MFSKNFLDLNNEDIVKEINVNGFFCCTEAVNSNIVEKLEEELSGKEFGVNKNYVSPVYCNDQYFFTNAMAYSKTYFDLITSYKLRSISRIKFKNYFRLKCQRYYETFFGHHMNWHADNVDNDGKIHNNDGLIFIIYVNDVFDGEFQLIQNTNLEKDISQRTINYTDAFVDKNYKSQIRNFKMKKGSIIIYDSWHIHRAKPISNSKYKRKSIFFQVDANEKNAEKLLLNPQFFNRDLENDKELFSYLGFGAQTCFAPVPNTSIVFLPVKKNLKLINELLVAAVKKSAKNFVKKFLTYDQISNYYNKKNKR